MLTSILPVRDVGTVAESVVGNTMGVNVAFGG
jgi:hypothetical protein